MPNYFRSSQEAKVNEILGVIAPKGSGKTTLALHIIRELRARAENVAVFDFMGEDGYAQACEDIVVGSPRDLWAAMHGEGFSIAYRPLEYDAKTGACPGFDFFCSISFKRGNLWVIVDEAHQFCNPHRIPKDLLSIARLGRHQRVSLVYITQSFTAVERTLTLNTNRFAFFRIIDPRDLDGIRDRCGPQVADDVAGLRKLDAESGIAGELKVWSDGGENSTLRSSEDFNLTTPKHRNINLS